MKVKIATVVAAGALGVTGLGVLAPALAAAAEGTSSTTAVADRVTRIKDALKGLVTDGTLTQAQSDKVASTLSTALPERGFGGRGGRGGGMHLADAAAALGMSEADLRTALESGKTLAQVAQAEGVSVDALVDELVAAAKARLAQAVTDGRITQAEADARGATLEQRITDHVTSTRPAHRGFRGDKDGSTASSAPSTTASPSSTA